MAHLPAHSQLSRVEAALDSTVCVIGGQVGLHLTVNSPESVPVVFPMLHDTLNADIEVLGQPAVDTTYADGRLRQTATYTLTCFEDSLYSLPQLPVVSGGDTIWSNPLSIRFIQPFEIDTTQLTLADIKPPVTPPFYWKGYALALLLMLCIVGIVVAIWFLVRKFFAKEVVIAKIPPQVRRRNAYDVAMGELNRIKDEKRWQQHGQQKAYHSELTDAVRQYIDDVYDFGCMEMPSSEILAEMKTRLKDNGEAYSQLSSILGIADLVKFAKYEALPDENEGSLNKAYSFVELTKPQPEEEENNNGNASEQDARHKV